MSISRHALSMRAGVFAGVFALALCAAGALHAAIEFQATELLLDEYAQQTVTPVFMNGDTAQLLVARVDDDNNRWLALYELHNRQWRSVAELPVEDDVYLYDIVSSGTSDRVMVYREGELCWFGLDGELTPFASINSMYQAPLEAELPRIDVARDLDDDGRDDLLLPDFAGWRLATQRLDASFTPTVLLGPTPFMGMSSERYVYFRARQAYPLDYDLDGRRDLAFWTEGAFQVFRQDEEGRFRTTSDAFHPNVGIEHDGFFSVELGEDAENPDGPQHILYDVDDLNGDTLDDVIVYTLEGKGLFGKQTSYAMHYGHRGEDGSLEFAPEPDTTIPSDGIQVGIERIDLDEDGTQEVMIMSVRFGLGTILKALFTQSVTLELSFYRMVDGVYPAEANVKRKISAQLDFSNGDMFVPAVITADVTGDGMQDLLVQNGTDELKIFPGIPGEGLFATRSINLALELPQNQDHIQVRDLDRNGVDDLLIQLEGPDSTTRVRALFF